MNIRFHEFAKREIEEAIEWYDLQSQGLGNRFKKILRLVVAKIGNHPHWFLKEDGELYKAYVPKFPYKVLYTVDDNEIVIWAIAHLHRKPRYWSDRLGSAQKHEI